MQTDRNKTIFNVKRLRSAAQSMATTTQKELIALALLLGVTVGELKAGYDQFSMDYQSEMK